MIGLKRILVPTDFSETSEAALRYGIALARAFEAQLYLLHVPLHPGEAAHSRRADRGGMQLPMQRAADPAPREVAWT